LIGLGEVGQVLAHDFGRLAQVQLRAWDRLLGVEGSPPQRALRDLPSLEAASCMAEAVRDRSIIVCAVTAAECLAAATEAAASLTPGTFYLDLNSVSPRTKTKAAGAVEDAGGCYVEAAVMSPIGPTRSASPLWLGGAHARDFLPLAQALGFSGAAVYSDTLGAASAVKMCRSVIVKGLEALLAESLVTAQHYGAADAVLASLHDLLPVPDWPHLARYMISRSLQHGRRRAEEMREVARTVTEAGLDPWMSRGCAERQEWAAKHAPALRHDTLADMLEEILARATTEPVAVGGERR
jgi:3-hydroxyisobutyrate dehydrogenase-like beta-hydroxyacid dehydrogenase